ncbi:senescence-associated carboxylesterase 101-like [Syzygium oleosum]|uniref:senescence-associated carboxylesterase 101-like n=1 Tax=Syzygium oleosum TaxID=219896 RepID=UPI0024B96A63|nr:senescence-associated carboxylesterase 101-like [Syzygium oleosum]
MEDPEHVFSNGLYLENLAVSTNILIDSWKAIFEYQGKNPDIITRKHQDCNFIAFVSSQVTTGDLQQESSLVPISEISDFKFLRSDTHQSFSINEAAFSQFNSLRGEFSELQEKVKTSFRSPENNKKENHIPYIITGHCLNGSIASLFTLSLLNTLDPTKYNLPLCITFGSPLLGDSPFQQAISRHRTCNSCFLHVVHRDDCVPRLFLVPPTTGLSSYEPFGTFLLCSESVWACFQAPDSVIELLKYKSPEIVAGKQEARTSDYKDFIELLEKIPFKRNVSSFLGHEADSYKAGITAQVTAVGLWPSQQQDEGTSALIENIGVHERIVTKRLREELDIAELDEMKVYLAFFERYVGKCRANGEGPGYYDSFKNARERRDNGVDKYKTYPMVYWEKVVEDAEKHPQLPRAPLRNRWLFAGNNYRRIVELLDIAEYYRRGRKDYLTRGRSDHYKLLQKWLEDRPKKEEKKDGPTKPKGENVMDDSCLWAHVEEAIRSCRRLDRASSEQEKLTKFEEYVMDLIKKHKVSSDIFLEKSSYMQWWKEYQDKVSHQSPLVNYMKNRHYINSGEGSPTDSNENPSDTSRSGPSTSGDPHGSQRFS